MNVTDLPYCAISGRPRWKVGDHYLVTRDKFSTHRVTDERTGVEYFVPYAPRGKEPLIEYETFCKRGHREGHTLAVRLLPENGPRHNEIKSIVDAIEN